MVSGSSKRIQLGNSTDPERGSDGFRAEIRDMGGRPKELQRTSRRDPVPQRAPPKFNRTPRMKSRVAPERSNATLPTNSGARRRRRTLAPGAREASTAACPEIRRGQPTLAGSDHDPRMRWRPTRTDRTGACFPSASARAAQRHRPSVRKRKSPTARRRRRVSISTRGQSPQPNQFSASRGPSPGASPPRARAAGWQSSESHPDLGSPSTHPSRR
jgi:hypothetical protein